jgi:hypothetical protein
VLDPSMNRRISYLCGRHDCSLLHSGGVVVGTVYDDRIPVSSDQRWPFPRGMPGPDAVEHHPRIRQGQGGDVQPEEHEDGGQDARPPDGQAMAPG